MPLNWKIENVENADEVGPDTPEWGVTEALIWAMQWVGYNRITADNVEDFTLRLHMGREVMGPLVTRWVDHGDPQERMITVADVRRRIGLETNWSPTSLAKFKAELIDRVKRTANSRLMRELAAEAEAEDTAAG